MNVHPEESNWIKAAKQGDTAAFRQLVEYHQAGVYRLSISLVKVAEEAEELTQDAFLKAYRALGKFREEAKFSVWLYRIVYNTAMTRLKKKRWTMDRLPDQDQEEEVAIAEGNKSALDQLTQQDQQQFLAKAVAQLADIDQTLIRLFYLQEMSVAEIAEITGLKNANIKIRLMRSRQKLHGCLKELLADEMSSLI